LVHLPHRGRGWPLSLLRLSSAHEKLGMRDMLTVTDSALNHLSSVLTKSERADGPDCFRLFVKDDQSIAMTLDSPQSGDQTFDCAGSTVLALPESLSAALSEKVLDLGQEGNLVFLPKPS
jgi:Fe-S cluster assembly iron-binding protein IscA